MTGKASATRKRSAPRSRATRPYSEGGAIASSLARWNLAAIRLGLSDAARELGAVLLAAELDDSVRRKLLGDDANRSAPRRAHLLAELTARFDERDVLAGLVELERRAVVRCADVRGPWMGGEVSIDTRVRHFACAREQVPPVRNPSVGLPDRIERCLRQIHEHDKATELFIVIRGRRGSGRDTVRDCVTAALGSNATTRTVSDLRAGVDPLEPELSGVISVWDARASDPAPDDYQHAREWLGRSTSACIAVLDAHQDAPELSERMLIELRTDLRDAAERWAMWASGLGRFALDAGRIESLARKLGARSRAGAGLATRALRTIDPRVLRETPGPRVVEETIWGLVQPSTTRGVVVERPGPESALSGVIVSDSVSRAIQHLLVLAQLNEQSPSPSRKGVKAMFSGLSGTGKTLAARAIAHNLELPLYRVDLASLVSKWLGETEKNLRHVFDAAESSGAVLLFDEGDALFGKRGDVERGTDRYANLEVSYLLQALEGHDGIVVVTTNLKAQIDRAFLRRFDICAEFHPPTRAQRILLWRRELGAEADRLDEHFLNRELAQVDLAGGNIAAAAHLACALGALHGGHVSEHDVRAAVESELSKLGAGATAARWAARPAGNGAGNQVR